MFPTAGPSRRPTRLRPPVLSTACNGWRGFRFSSRGDFERGASISAAWMPRQYFPMRWPSALRAIRTRPASKARSRRRKRAHWECNGWKFLFPTPTSTIIRTTRSSTFRSYGENRRPMFLPAFVSAFIISAHSVPGARVLTTAKHFPGHGDTATDTHLNLGTDYRRRGAPSKRSNGPHSGRRSAAGPIPS